MSRFNCLMTNLLQIVPLYQVMSDTTPISLLVYYTYPSPILLSVANILLPIKIPKMEKKCSVHRM